MAEVVEMLKELYLLLEVQLVLDHHVFVVDCWTMITNVNEFSLLNHLLNFYVFHG